MVEMAATILVTVETVGITVVISKVAVVVSIEKAAIQLSNASRVSWLACAVIIVICAVSWATSGTTVQKTSRRWPGGGQVSV